MRKNRATTAIPQADIPLPAPPSGFFDAPWEPGRVLSKDETRAWRLIYYTPGHLVTDHEAGVFIRALQYSDGSLGDVEIIAEGLSFDTPLNKDQARELAAALLEVAKEVDRWTVR